MFSVTRTRKNDYWTGKINSQRLSGVRERMYLSCVFRLMLIRAKRPVSHHLLPLPHSTHLVSHQILLICLLGSFIYIPNFLSVLHMFRSGSNFIFFFSGSNLILLKFKISSPHYFQSNYLIHLKIFGAAGSCLDVGGVGLKACRSSDHIAQINLLFEEIQ